ncbi:hypothetical protein [Silvibacterium dinghuense]|uniref:Uncharacterized protein n=1 Tax=Silvibacterium dinghuense TaxID=1560006 RepID=A0A4Q1SJJ8_9BACT|nr:hypothetical protein [Silvibacterium dinghuense]RXS97613.1 hypothetical protein ESZ00_06950 [Silvibacterium dinghuense]GGH00501.1 hypothetical protein GCM10011586_15100 [Silvibacterium dinghuense]
MQVLRSCVRKVVFGSVVALALAVSLLPSAMAQGDIVTALKQKYRLSEINMQGVVVNPGTVFTVEADGINAEPYPTMITFENPVVDGQVKQRSKGLGFLKSSNLQILQPGQKVYITKINSSSGNDDELKVTIITSDAVLATYSNGAYGGQYQAAKRYSTTLAFKLPKGALTQMSLDDASKMIEAILSINAADQVRVHDAGVVTRSCEPHCAISATTGAPVGTPSAEPGGAPAGSNGTPTISLGQSIDQVTGVMGQPQQIVDLGSKKIYKYPDMKVVFVDGKVSDVQ